MKNIKPIHKFNGGLGATLCHKCRIIITTGLTDDLYCQQCKSIEESIIFDSEEDEKIFFEFLNQPEFPNDELLKAVKMTEKQLISAGFEKEEVSAEEAGTDKGYYFYVLEIGDIELISNPNDKLVNGQWACYFLNSDEIEIIYAFHLQMLISVLKQSLKNKSNNLI